MDIELENNVGAGIKESVLIKSSINGLSLENGGEIQIVDLASDSPSGSNDGDEYVNLPGLGSDSEDSRLLSKSDLLKSLSDIDNIVIKNRSSIMSAGGMFMQHMNKSLLQNVSEDVQNCSPRENIVTINGINSFMSTDNDEIDEQR